MSVCQDLAAQVTEVLRDRGVTIRDESHILDMNASEFTKYLKTQPQAPKISADKLKVAWAERMTAPCQNPGLWHINAEYFFLPAVTKASVTSRNSGLYTFHSERGHVGTALFTPFTAKNVVHNQRMALVSNTSSGDPTTQKLLEEFLTTPTRKLRDHTRRDGRPAPMRPTAQDLGDPRENNWIEIKLICATGQTGSAVFPYLISQIAHKHQKGIAGLILEAALSHGEYKQGRTRLADLYSERYGFEPAEIWVARADEVYEYDADKADVISYEANLYMVRPGTIEGECRAFLDATAAHRPVYPRDRSRAYVAESTKMREAYRNQQRMERERERLAQERERLAQEVAAQSERLIAEQAAVTRLEEKLALQERADQENAGLYKDAVKDAQKQGEDRLARALAEERETLHRAFTQEQERLRQEMDLRLKEIEGDRNELRAQLADLERPGPPAPAPAKAKARAQHPRLKLYCGAPPLPPNRRQGSVYQCYLKGIKDETNTTSAAKIRAKTALPAPYCGSHPGRLQGQRIASRRKLPGDVGKGPAEARRAAEAHQCYQAGRTSSRAHV